MKTKHTPGPWKFIGAYQPGIDSEPENFSIIIWGEDDEFGNGIQGRTEEEGQANAKLIAAAPEMLHLLGEIEAWLSFRPDPPKDQLAEMKKTIQEAIKKATS